MHQPYPTSLCHAAGGSSPSGSNGAGSLPLVSEEDSEPPDGGCSSVNEETAPVAAATSSAMAGGTRRNPWGNHSYADLITQAISQAPDQRLTLAQIYEWLIKNISHFREKSDSVSSTGWKVTRSHQQNMSQLQKTFILFCILSLVIAN